MHATRLVVGAILVALVPAQDTVTVLGSTTVRPIVEKIVPAFRKEHPAVQISVDGGGSGKGIAAAGKGDAQVGMASRAPKDADKQAHPDLVFHKLGVDGVSIVVHKSNPVRNLTKEQLRGIYLGKSTDWKQLGGEGPIVALAATTNHGTYECFAEFLNLDGTESDDHAKVTLRPKGDKDGGFAVRAIDGNRALLGAVVADKQAIACVSTGAAHAMRVKGAPVATVSLDGAEPSEANLLAGKYAFQRPLFLVTKGAPQGNAKALVEFVLSAQGQQVVKGLDFVPATPLR
jgi:phosphate transport system substrate-binding protein